jgi:hypothetical protein
VAGSVPYQTAAGATSYTPAGTSNQVLMSNGAAAPSWTSTPTFGVTNVSVTGAGTVGITITGSNTRGGTGYADVLQFTNASSGTTNPNKFIRVDSAGTIQILNSAYTTGLWSLTDTGVVTQNGNLTFSSANTNINPHTTSGSVVFAPGNSGSVALAYSDVSYNPVFGDYTNANCDTYIESGRGIFISPNGNNSSSKANSSWFSNAGIFYLNCTGTPAGVGTGGQMFLNSAGDMATWKSTASGNNGMSMWQTGTTTNTMLAFQKGATQTQVGGISCSTTATAYNTSSDYRVKTNITPIQGGLDRVMSLPAVAFDFTNGDQDHSEGFIAHEVQAVFPYAVHGDKDAVYADGSNKLQSVDYGRLTPLLVAAIQELKAEVDALKAQLAAQ